jgi:hypothetical protein
MGGCCANALLTYCVISTYYLSTYQSSSGTRQYYCPLPVPNLSTYKSSSKTEQLKSQRSQAKLVIIPPELIKESQYRFY